MNYFVLPAMEKKKEKKRMVRGSDE